MRRGHGGAGLGKAEQGERLQRAERVGEGGPERAQRGEEKTGPRVWAARGGGLGCWCGPGKGKVGRGAGPAKLGWVGLVFPVPLIFLFSISYFKHHTNYLNSNSNLNSTLALK